MPSVHSCELDDRGGVLVRPNPTAATFIDVSTPAPARPARARLGRWPFDDAVVHLVLLDHHMVPTADDLDDWVRQAHGRGASHVRTGALFPNATAPFLDAGFRVIDTLTLLAADLEATAHLAPAPGEQTSVRMRRLRPRMLAEAATIDRRSFARQWANDRAALDEITAATPFHRSRSIHLDGRMVAFSISGRADQAGYVQRVAVDPSARRRGFARLLVDDALGWMRRRGVTRALVNTAADNRGALTLYQSVGFVEQPGQLLILERALR